MLNRMNRTRDYGACVGVTYGASRTESLRQSNGRTVEKIF